MSMTLIPETAPFTSEQRAWLNGFFAGMLGAESSTNASSSFPSAAQNALLDAPTVQTQLEDDEEFPWHDPGLDLEERIQLAQGKRIELKLMAAMAQLDCGACGYLCHSYSAAIASGEEKSLSKCVPGGKPTSKMLKKLLEENTSPESNHSASLPNHELVSPRANGSISSSANGQVAAVSSRDNPVTVKLVSSECLNGEGSDKDTRHVVIDLSGTNLSYNVGDALGVYPTNCGELVRAIIESLHASGNELVTLPGHSARTLQEALTHACCLKDVNDDLIELMIASTPDLSEQEAIRQFIDQDNLGHHDLLDLLSEFPSSRPHISDLVAALTRLTPRLYSIASSQKKYTNQVHLTVGRQSRDHRGRLRKGVASTMFSDRLEPGDLLQVFVQPAHGFCIPKDDSLPLIMVGPGTGIAPFRAFLQERQAREAKGPNWLFFGDQKSKSDFLYRDELQGFVETGLLTRLDLAFSRDQAEKVYVQNRMIEHGAQIYTWLQQGGYFCVCGDAKRMARDVDQALHALVEQHGQMTPAQAKAYVLDMSKQKRYLRDVY